MVDDSGKLLGLLMPDNFHSMYHLRLAEVKCKKEYLDNFYVVHPTAHMLMNPWYREEEDLKDRVGITKYSPIPCISPV